MRHNQLLINVVHVFLLVLVMIFLNGCTDRNISNATQNSIDNIPYSTRSSMSLAVRKDDITNLYGKPDVVRTQNDYTYEIRNLSDGSKFFVFYNDNVATDAWRLKELIDRSKFDKISPMKSTVNVMPPLVKTRF
ncbi:MAG: hypothetical protein P4L69_00480 [Desulfosporosinus sp.]|nr:hypothetical protein [Desulfosporosinus sp.]